MNKLMRKYRIFYGLGGGFGGATEYHEIIEARYKDDAEEFAYQLACEEYNNNAGLYGIRTIEEIMEENEIYDEDEAEYIYSQERESWLEYWVEEIIEEE